MGMKKKNILMITKGLTTIKVVFFLFFKIFLKFKGAVNYLSGWLICSDWMWQLRKSPHWFLVAWVMLY